ncbi:hypothetical protein BN8_05208 [Fibrisoma limi BUZ 3]|uniref:Uncharacterized protein n=1 Tax=Fibrisoma limi BUZ 3 TaxID=1185876 RepID=I2GPT0_9BACT|nr:hypothetical protein BN8_05208 [Fibrisoma limi BUZ 3]
MPNTLAGITPQFMQTFQAEFAYQSKAFFHS